MHSSALGVAWLELQDGSRKNILNSCSIGRSDSNQIVLVDSKVSRRHSIIHAQGENEFWLVDLGSSNGTYLNGRRVSQPTRLQNRDRVSVGDALFVFRQAEMDSQASQTQTAVTIRDIRTVPCWLLLADMINSTELSRKLSAENLSMVTGSWLAGCKEIIDRNGGSINKFLGDGFFAYWPEDAQAKLTVAQALADLKEIQAKQNPMFRIVLHYGDVAVGGMASMGEESLMGQEVNFVFRMEKLAASLRQTCLMSDAARQQLPPSMAASGVGKHSVAGFTEETDFHSF